MAAKFRKIDPRIWTDEGFSRLAPEAKLLAFWLLTSARTNRCGVVLWSAALAAEETGVRLDRVEGVLDTVCRTVSWTFDPTSKTVFLGRWWRYNRPDNPSALKGALSDLHDVPRNNLKPALLRAMGDLPTPLHGVYRTVLDTVYDTVSPQEKEQEKEQEQEQEREGAAAPPTPAAPAEAAPEPGPRRFVPPTVEEVAAYCRERGNAVDARTWHDFYASKGWMVGRNKMRDWRACVRTWERDRGGAGAKKPAASLADQFNASAAAFLAGGGS